MLGILGLREIHMCTLVRGTVHCIILVWFLCWVSFNRGCLQKVPAHRGHESICCPYLCYSVRILLLLERTKNRDMYINFPSHCTQINSHAMDSERTANSTVTAEPPSPPFASQSKLQHLDHHSTPGYGKPGILVQNFKVLRLQ